MPMTLYCQTCTNPFEVELSRKNARFCSNACKGQARRDSLTSSASSSRRIPGRTYPRSLRFRFLRGFQSAGPRTLFRAPSSCPPEGALRTFRPYERFVLCVQRFTLTTPVSNPLRCVVREPGTGTKTVCGDGHHLLHRQGKVYLFICSLCNVLCGAAAVGIGPTGQRPYICPLKEAALRTISVN